MKDKSLIHDIVFFLFVIVALAIMVVAQNHKSEESKMIGVHIKGEVNAPGYYELEYGSRIKDVIILAGGETEKSDLTNINLALQPFDGEEIVIPSKSEAKTEPKKAETGLTNINTADIYQLCKLDGIGEVLAGEIVRHRAENGPFKSIDDLKKVKGIGNSKFNKIKDKISTQ